MEYKVLCSGSNDFERQLAEAAADGWTVHTFISHKDGSPHRLHEALLVRKARGK